MKKYERVYFKRVLLTILLILGLMLQIFPCMYVCKVSFC